ncbi:HAD-superfamily subfamily IB hydrolase, TIGR01490 [Frankineae bacterium MT45]|nr:HAD-superfamily subfamily IB hydrolase, TIGR01490 [Frankineae bacterium MT45]
MTEPDVFAAAVEIEAALAVPADPTAAAFFDVDNTMMVGASIFHFARGLAARDFFDWTDLLRFGLRQARLRVRGESQHDMASTRESALAFVAGKSVEEIVTLGEEIYDESMADKIWSGTSALAQMHLDSGQRVWLVTATPVELARIIANRLKLTGALGTVSETVDGRYTGHLIGDVLHGEAKAAAVRALAVQEGLDLSRCTAYSDSINDLPMLSLVGTAVAVNPDAELRAEARRRGWQIRDFRTGRKAARIGVPTALGVGAVAGAVVAGAAVRRAYAAPHSPLARRTTATRRASLELLTATVDMAGALGSAAVHTTTRAATGTAELARKYQRHTERRLTSSL